MAYPEVKVVVVSSVSESCIHFLIRQRPGPMLIIEIIRSAANIRKGVGSDCCFVLSVTKRPSLICSVQTKSKAKSEMVQRMVRYIL